MADYYNLDIIPIILTRFKVTDIVISGSYDKNIFHQVFTYCDKNDVSFIAIDSNENINENVIRDYPLNVLPNLNDYGAIFLNDDPNWYTVYNELKFIKKTNEEFPLVFICHNIFPHKRRDSYTNPNSIPKEFLNDFAKELNYHNILIQDDFFHAIEENTSKNGVLTAIEDFIEENSSIGIMNLKFLNGMTILYPKNNISKIRIGHIFEEIKGYELEYDDLLDNIVENQILIKHITRFNMNSADLDVIENFKIELDEKEKIIADFEDEISLQSTELSFKDSKIDNFNSKLELKESKFKNIESKLVNRDVVINNLNKQLNNANSEISSLKSNISQREKRELELNKQIENNINQLNNANSEISSLKSNISQKEKKELELNSQIKDSFSQLNNKNHEILIKDNQLKTKEQELNSFKHHYTSQLSKLDNKEYCISCYKEEINNNHLEIQYLRKDTLTRKLLSPLAYVYLIFKSKPKELSINFKLYRAMKESKCFDIGYYLANNKDIQESKWCKYFSPELHYVCNGFGEKRKFNKKYFNRNSKKELLDYIINCP